MVKEEDFKCLLFENIKPISINQAYKSYRGRFVLSKIAKDFKFIVSNIAIEKMKLNEYEMTTSTIEVFVILYFKNLKKRRHDIDNYNKLIFDSLNGIVWQDDSQIKKLHVYFRNQTMMDGFAVVVKDLN